MKNIKKVFVLSFILAMGLFIYDGQVYAEVNCDSDQDYCIFAVNDASHNSSNESNAQSGSEITATEYPCKYTGKIDGKTLTIIRDSKKWIVKYPDGSSKIFTNTNMGSNSFPSSKCEDILYIKNNDDKKIIMIENTMNTQSQVSTLCGINGNYVEQFCSNGKCKVNDLKCGSSTSLGNQNGEGCPEELRLIVVFLKRVVFNTVQLFVPILLILMGTIDFAKAVMASDDKGNKEAISKFIKRCGAALMVFFLATIISVVMGMFAKTNIGEQDSWKTCWNSIK